MQDVKSQGEENKKDLGYPPYPAGDDIYNKNDEQQNIDPEDLSEEKAAVTGPDAPNEENYDDDAEMGGDLDVPGEELDDMDEDIGEEDEENNYYSLGGDKDD
jgi:hypothetical protein